MRIAHWGLAGEGRTPVSGQARVEIMHVKKHFYMILSVQSHSLDFFASSRLVLLGILTIHMLTSFKNRSKGDERA